MSQVHNEQTKLPATGLNNVAVAFVVIGGVSPVTAMSFVIASAPSLSFGTFAFAVIWLCSGVAVHWAARHALRSLKP